MRPIYKMWIEDHVPEDCSGMCKEISMLMAGAFPELRQVKGVVTTVGPHGSVQDSPHWWCLDEELGQHVDPTQQQFCDVLKWKRIEEEIVGKCLNCACYVEEGNPYGPDLCCKTCSNQYMAYLDLR